MTPGVARWHPTVGIIHTMAAMGAAGTIMTVSRNGQVSIPAAARARWKAAKVLVVDLGDRVVVRPLGDDPLTELQGKYRGRGPRSDVARSIERREDERRVGDR